MSRRCPLKFGGGCQLPFLLGAALDPEEASIPSKGDPSEAPLGARDDVRGDGRPPGPVRRRRGLVAAGRRRGGWRGGRCRGGGHAGRRGAGSPVAEAGESAVEEVGRGGSWAARRREDGGEACRHLRCAGSVL